MDLTILGSGNVAPSPTRRPPGYLLRVGAWTALIDAGPGTLSTLASLGIRARDIDVVLLSHLHPDHALDLVHLLFYRSVADPGDVNPSLRIVGPAGFREEMASWLAAIHPATLETDVPLGWVEMGEAPLDLGPLRVRAFEVDHRRASPSGAVGYYLESRDGILSYTGDTALTRSLVPLLDRRACVLCECTTPDDDPLPGHLTPSAVRRLVEHNPPHLLVLTHLSPAFAPGDLPGEAFRGYPGRVAVAEDGMVISFDPSYIRVHAPEP